MRDVEGIGNEVVRRRDCCVMRDVVGIAYKVVRRRDCCMMRDAVGIGNEVVRRRDCCLMRDVVGIGYKVVRRRDCCVMRDAVGIGNEVVRRRDCCVMKDAFLLHSLLTPIFNSRTNRQSMLGFSRRSTNCKFGNTDKSKVSLIQTSRFRLRSTTYTRGVVPYSNPSVVFNDISVQSKSFNRCFSMHSAVLARTKYSVIKMKRSILQT